MHPSPPCRPVVRENTDMGADRPSTALRNPSRSIALLLGLIGPRGAGQFHLGQTKRAVLWLLVPVAPFTLYAAAIPWFGGAVGFGLAFGLLLLGALGMFLAPLVDVFLVPASRLRRAAGIKIFGYWVAGILFSMVAPLPTRMFILEAFKIPSPAMQPALLVGDHFMADKLVLKSRRPKRGEAVVFKFPERPEQDFVKRVIAVAGDRLEVKDGHPWINGWEVPHCLVGKATMPGLDGKRWSGELHVEYLDGEAYLAFFDENAALGEVQGPYVVADNEVWVLGDNRNNSYDSRLWFGGRGGGVPLDHVKARALFRWATITDERVDSSRFGTALAEPLLPASMKTLEGYMQKCLAQRPPREKTLPPAR